MSATWKANILVKDLNPRSWDHFPQQTPLIIMIIIIIIQQENE